ncbi:MAG: phosphoribosylformylglycinamidine synthase subunit PurQ [Candidatus Bathyarchaeia archaeon]
MKRGDIRVCVLRVGGTNCDAETRLSFAALGVQAEVVHVNEVVKRKSLMEYDVLVFPGGFSYGDYVRAGAIWAKWILAKLGKELKAFVDEGRLILGICNGFQVLVETGLLPGFEGMSPYPEAGLATNFPPGYNCRWISLKHENNGKCAFTSQIPKGKVLRVPVAHSEGRFLFPKEKEKQYLEKLRENDQLVFRYCNKDGEYAEDSFPTNPNGSFHDIAGICNPEGTVFGLMPHPERAFHWWQQADWTRHQKMPEHGDGKLIFENLINYLEKV